MINLDRRSFFAAGSAAAFASFVTLDSGPRVTHVRAEDAEKPLKPLRVSVVKGDPGERAYAECCADRRKITVYLNGQEQDRVITADAAGTLTRISMSPNGNILVNFATNEIIEETVTGQVVIVIGEPGSA